MLEDDDEETKCAWIVLHAVDENLSESFWDHTIEAMMLDTGQHEIDWWQV